MTAALHAFTLSGIAALTLAAAALIHTTFIF